MQHYYTLEQAAQILRTTPDQLKEMARSKEIRAFQDRSGWRFRAQEIDELARERGFGSDPELPLGDVAKAAEAGGKEVFNFSLEGDDSEDVPLGKQPADSGKHGPRSPSSSRKSAHPKSPPPKASSDSDVRLVIERSDMDFPVVSDSKAPGSKPPVSPVPKKPASSKTHPGPTIKEDSGVRIVPLDQASDSDVKVVPASPHDSTVSTGGQKVKKSSDSDIRIEEIHKGGPRDKQIVTEEIDLDAEQRKAEAAPKPRKVTQHKPKTQAGGPGLPTSSPFELSESDVNLKGQAGPRAPEKADTDSSSDFELKPMSDSSPLELGSDELPVIKGDEEVNLGELGAAQGGSGINLQDPADSGISLEKGSSEEFELSVDPAAGASKPSDSDSDSSSDFELGIKDEGDSSPTDEGSSSEFELSLDAGGSSDLAVDEGSSDLALEQPASDSDSEFELTLDESGGLSLEEDSGSEEQDMMPTDFEAPAIDEESGSDAVALDEGDTDLESSEFDLALESADESGSQVVPLEDEEEADAGSATVQRKAVGRRGAAAEEGLEDIGEALDEDLEAAPEAEEEAEALVPTAPAEWGVMTPVAALLCTILLFFVSLISFELMQGMWGYHKGAKVGNTLIHPLAKMFSGDDKLPDE